MKIGGQASGGFGGSGGFSDGSTPEERRRRFAARHKPGDIVRGRVLGPEGPDLVWVGFGAETLLVPALPACPRGSLVLFRVASLSPDIVLTPLRPAPGTPAALAAAGARFTAARAAYETALDAAAEAGPDSRQPDTVPARELAAAIAELTGALPPGLSLTCPYDLLPQARELECLTREADAGAPRGAELGFRLPETGRVRASLMAGPSRGSFRLRAEHPQAATALAERLAAPQGNPLGQPLDCLGVSALPPGAPGALAEIIRATKGMGRDRVV